jgi:hypothetical protein
MASLFRAHSITHLSTRLQTETNWMDELDSKLRNLEELEAARAKEAWEKHVVSTILHQAICHKEMLYSESCWLIIASLVTYKWLNQTVRFRPSLNRL